MSWLACVSSGLCKPAFRATALGSLATQLETTVTESFPAHLAGTQVTQRRWLISAGSHPRKQHVKSGKFKWAIPILASLAIGKFLLTQLYKELFNSLPCASSTAAPGAACAALEASSLLLLVSCCETLVNLVPRWEGKGRTCAALGSCSAGLVFL